MSAAKSESAGDKTIRDFGDQWTRHTENEGYYASQELFADIVEPLIPVADFASTRCADIGSGTGRIVAMLAEASAAEVCAVEPSAAYDVLAANVAKYGARVRCVRAPGQDIPRDDFDIIVAMGVLHHIPDPAPVVRAAYAALRPGGRMLAWLYGREGNGAYLAFALPLRAVTRRLPVKANEAIASGINGLLSIYIWLCHRVRWLPMATYMRNVLARFTPDVRRLAIIDQLNPEWSKYYTRREAERLLADEGFMNVRTHHRHGYSWTVVGTKPAVAAERDKP